MTTRRRLWAEVELPLPATDLALVTATALLPDWQPDRTPPTSPTLFPREDPEVAADMEAAFFPAITEGLVIARQ